MKQKNTENIMKENQEKEINELNKLTTITS